MEKPRLNIDSVDCEKAIQCAIIGVSRCPHFDAETKRNVCSTLHAILEQRGCEHLDPGVTDGKLTTAMDIAIFG